MTAVLPEASAQIVKKEQEDVSFEAWVPNATTIAAMEDARAGRVKRFATLDELMEELNRDDEDDEIQDASINP